MTQRNESMSIANSERNINFLMWKTLCMNDYVRGGLRNSIQPSMFVAPFCIPFVDLSRPYIINNAGLTPCLGNPRWLRNEAEWRTHKFLGKTLVA